LFLSVIGQNCPNIKELDVAGADIVSGELVMNIIPIIFIKHQGPAGTS
jgi:hypothetical protein